MKNSTYLIAGMLSVGLLVSCNQKSGTMEKTQTLDTPQKEVTEEPNVLASTEKENNIAITGYVDVPPENRAAISPYYGGFVTRIGVLEGQQVKKGETLFRLENPDYIKVQQEYLESKEQLEYLKADYERQKQLATEKIASTKNFKKAEMDFNVVQSKYNALKEQIRLMGLSIPSIEAGKLFSTISIKAPIAGNITAVNISKSVYADAKEVAVELVNLDHIHLELEVFEKDALRIQEGQMINFRIPESGSKVYKGEVHLVGKTIDPQKRTVKVHGHIEDKIEGLIPGMFVEAEIVLP
ncbi:MAG: efflux RND transporter periplasmic adaptor subunit [Cyclobacteriaceae bacterium]